MPLAYVRVNPTRVSYVALGKICEALPPIAAEALSTEEGGKLTPDRIIVEPTGEFSHMAKNVKDLSIIIFAHEFAERRANLDERRRQIQQEVIKYLERPDNTYQIWIWLGCTSYGSDTQD